MNRTLIFAIMVGLLFIGVGCTNNGQPQTIAGTEPENMSVDENGGVEACMSELGHDSLIFLYSPTCPHCHNMQPIVDDLINNGYKIEKLNSYEDNDMISEINTRCVHLQPYVPQFICPTDGKIKVGEMSKEALEQFYNSCFN